MNERFKELPEERQRAVLNSAMEVFSKYDYKKASTDLIAAKAGVSKGLLFYYFHNKKELYLFVYEYSKNIITGSVLDSKLFEITDFFELITYVTMQKVKLLTETPYIMDFLFQSFYSDKTDILDDLKATIIQEIEDNFDAHLSNTDFTKFKKNVAPGKVFKMLTWLLDGYLHEQRMSGNTLCLDEIEKEIIYWLELFKGVAYKEEYL